MIGEQNRNIRSTRDKGDGRSTGPIRLLFTPKEPFTDSSVYELRGARLPAYAAASVVSLGKNSMKTPTTRPAAAGTTANLVLSTLQPPAPAEIDGRRDDRGNEIAAHTTLNEFGLSQESRCGISHSIILAVIAGHPVDQAGLAVENVTEYDSGSQIISCAGHCYRTGTFFDAFPCSDWSGGRQPDRGFRAVGGGSVDPLTGRALVQETRSSFPWRPLPEPARVLVNETAGKKTLRRVVNL